MHITLAICTWNCADLLDITLKSLAEIDIPAGITWKVVVADNNSSDHTQEIVRRHLEKLPLSSIFVAKQGKSHALNRVVELLEGDLVLWTDDDVRIDPGWMQAYVDASRAWPQADFFGGWVIPQFLAPEPDWLRPAWTIIEGAFATRELGDEPFAFSELCLPYGANLAMRVSAQKQYRYEPELGRRGELMLAGEETYQLRQMMRDGRRGMWVPQARVGHLITPDRMEVEHLRRFFFGIAKTRTDEDREADSLRRLVKGCRLVWRAMKYEMKARFYAQQRSHYRWMKSISLASQAWGRASAVWSQIPDWMKPPVLKATSSWIRQPRYKNARSIFGESLSKA